jgi:Zn-dependent peptidase ImmA (M78 family)/DNA-binding XRE family transcriptional regulator
MPLKLARSWQEIGRRVADARRAAGVSQVTLAHTIGLEHSAISKMESGQRRIDTIEIAKIARALGRSIEWFLSAPRPAIVSRRSGRDEPRRLGVDALLEELADGVELLVDLGLLSPTPLRVERALASVRDAERAADEARQRLGLRAGPLRDLLAEAEKAGLYGFVLELGAEVDGSYVTLDRGGVALVNGRAESGRRRFTLAHELGHHVLADEYSTDFDLSAGLQERERLINAFAVHFLMPRASVAARWSELRGDGDARTAAIFVACEYGVSWSAACSQLCNLGLLAERERQALMESPPRRADYVALGIGAVAEPAAPLVPPQYAAAVIKAYKASEVSAQRALELLRGSLGPEDLPPTQDGPFAAFTDV